MTKKKDIWKVDERNLRDGQIVKSNRSTEISTRTLAVVSLILLLSIILIPLFV